MVKCSLQDEGLFAGLEGFTDAADVEFDERGSYRLFFLLLGLRFLGKGCSDRGRAWWCFLLESLFAQGDSSFPDSSTGSSLMVAMFRGRWFFRGQSLNMCPGQ